MTKDMINVTKGNVVPLRAVFNIDGRDFCVADAQNIRACVRSLYKSYECVCRRELSSDNVLLVDVPAHVSSGVYGLEVKGTFNGVSWRCFAHSVLEITTGQQRGSSQRVSSAGDIYDIVMSVELYKGSDVEFKELVDRVVVSSHYDSASKSVDFYNLTGGIVFSADLSSMDFGDTLTDVSVAAGNVVFRLSSGKELSLPVRLIFDNYRYYDKDEINGRLTDLLQVLSSACVFGCVVDSAEIVDDYCYESNDDWQVCYIASEYRFAYRREAFGETTYFARWNNWEKYLDKWGYPYMGKAYYCGESDKLCYLGMGMNMLEVGVKMPIEFISADVGTLHAEFDRYYRIDGYVSNMEVVLPSSILSTRSETVLLLSTYKTSAVLFRSGSKILYDINFSIDGSQCYEIVCSYYGDRWVIKSRQLRI